MKRPGIENPATTSCSFRPAVIYSSQLGAVAIEAKRRTKSKLVNVKDADIWRHIILFRLSSNSNTTLKSILRIFNIVFGIDFTSLLGVKAAQKFSRG